ncbi:MAG: phytoene desaturase [Gracilimonas sp.]|uniref:phytoene desaturase n=1 Tax=Gracilimonas sp. TaxID=1974203 RepID=UPI0019A24838|nr:phytoene desaturase [Gracilimonas sp.]MBD3616781.1 phytoene desaturase [Gracilimonas sp.]
MKKKIIVIGSGFGGLGAASRLLSAGHEVTILEKRDKLGGRAYVYEKNGFKFDGGPTVITAPFMFDDIFEAAGKKREEYVKFVPCDPFYRIFDAEGKHFDYNNDHEFTLEEIRKQNPDDVEGYEKFLGTTKAIFDKGFVELADKPFLKFTDMLKVAPDLIKLQSYKTVYKYVAQFIKDEFLRRCFSFHPLLVGGNPFDTTSIYAMIHYLEREWGVHYAMGGTGAIVNALEKLILEQGGQIHTETEVDEILVVNGEATGVRLKNGEILKADKIVSNADVAFTYKNLINPIHRKKYTDRKIERTKYSMSLFIIYFGTKKRYLDSGLAHHNIILGKRYKELLEDIFHKKHLSDDFSLYLHMPTVTDPSMAPEGCEGFYVLSPVPHLDSGTDWNEMAPKYRDIIMNFLEENYLPDLKENIITEHYIDPLHFKNELNSYKGSAFSVEPILTQSAWFRPHNKSEDVENLYFVGAGTHPGAGLPGVLSSSIIAQDLIGSA